MLARWMVKLHGFLNEETMQSIADAQGTPAAWRNDDDHPLEWTGPHNGL